MQLYQSLPSQQSNFNAKRTIFLFFVFPCRYLVKWVLANSFLTSKWWNQTWGSQHIKAYFESLDLKILCLHIFSLKHQISGGKKWQKNATFRSSNLKNWIFKSSVLKFPQIWPIFSLQENMWGAPNSGCAEQRCDYSVLPVSLWVLIALPWFSRCWTMLLPDQHQKPLQKGYYVCLCLSVL